MKWLPWNIVARVLQMVLAGIGAYLIGKSGVTADFWERASALILEGTALIWANWHGTSEKTPAVTTRVIKKLTKGKT